VLDSQPLTLLAAALMLLLCIIALQILADLVKTRSFRKLLASYPVAITKESIHVLATNIPMAFSSGLLRPQIFLSMGLVQKLSAEEQQMVIAHEKTHLQRRDSLRFLLARAFSLGHLPFVRKALLAHLHLAGEQVCDAVAAREAQDPAKVAELLLKIEKLYQVNFSSGSPLVLRVLGNGPNTLPERIQALLAPPLASRSSWSAPRIVLLATFVVLVSHDLVHDGLEHVLTLFIQG
jgi:Zn-dependent protease with chaperone function